MVEANPYFGLKALCFEKGTIQSVFLVFISTKVNTPNWSTYIFEILPLAVLCPPPSPRTQHPTEPFISSVVVFLFIRLTTTLCTLLHKVES